MNTDEVRAFEEWFSQDMDEYQTNRALERASAGHYKLMQAHSDSTAFIAGYQQATKESEAFWERRTKIANAQHILQRREDNNEITQLKAEIKRLKEVGDVVVHELQEYLDIEGPDCVSEDAIDHWNALKEADHG